jgi:hypothetical protein
MLELSGVKLVWDALLETFTQVVSGESSSSGNRGGVNDSDATYRMRIRPINSAGAESGDCDG